MVLQISALWAIVGHTLKFLKACAKPGQAAKNGNF
jgi:hypothetical protein